MPPNTTSSFLGSSGVTSMLKNITTIDADILLRITSDDTIFADAPAYHFDQPHAQFYLDTNSQRFLRIRPKSHPNKYLVPNGHGDITVQDLPTNHSTSHHTISNTSTYNFIPEPVDIIGSNVTELWRFKQRFSHGGNPYMCTVDNNQVVVRTFSESEHERFWFRLTDPGVQNTAVFKTISMTTHCSPVNIVSELHSEPLDVNTRLMSYPRLVRYWRAKESRNVHKVKDILEEIYYV